MYQIIAYLKCVAPFAMNRDDTCSTCDSHFRAAILSINIDLSVPVTCLLSRRRLRGKAQ